MLQNITTFGWKSKALLAQLAEEDCEYCAVALAEHHLEEHKIAEAETLVRRVGGQPFWTQAAPSAKGGSHGGTALVIAGKVRAERLDRDMVDPISHLPREADDFIAVVISLGGVRLILAVLYLTAGQGFGPVNARKLARLGALLRRLALPWLVVADWNAEPTQLIQSGWAARLGGVIMAPDVALTCTSGEGRLIDFGLLSFSARSIVKKCGVTKDTFKPHLGVWFELHRNPAEAQIRVMKKPPVMKLPPCKKGHGLEDNGERKKPPEIGSKKTTRATRKRIRGKQGQPQPLNLLDPLAYAAGEVVLAEALATWERPPPAPWRVGM